MAKETPRRTRPAPMPSEAERFARLRARAQIFQEATDDDIRAALARWCEGFCADLDALIASDNPVELDLGELIRSDYGDAADQEESQQPTT